MKRLITLAIIILFGVKINAQVLPVKFYVFTAKTSNRTSATAANNADVKPGAELNTFQVPAGDESLWMFIHFNVTDYKKLAVAKGLHLMVRSADKSDDRNFFDWYWKPLTKNAPIYANYAFAPGSYIVNLVDNDHPEKVFATRSITVKPSETSVANAGTDGFRYNRSHFKIWTCKSVDETAWKPIGQTTKIKAGSCVTLFFDSMDKLKNEGSMRWGIYRIGADGSENVVSQKDQAVDWEKWSKLYHEECEDFTIPGKYRIYVATKYDSDTHSNVNGDHYFAKADLEVE